MQALRPSDRRRRAEELNRAVAEAEALGTSARRACRLLGVSRATQARHRSSRGRSPCGPGVALRDLLS